MLGEIRDWCPRRRVICTARGMHREMQAMAASYETGPYDPCPCGSGAKYKFCCAAKAKANRHGKFPIGTVAHYGPDDQTTTKIVAGVVLRDNAEPLLERWVGTGVLGDPKIAEGIKRFFAQHGVKSVIVTDGNLGCPHEEGSDFPRGKDCPFCPFWAGKQGSARRDDVVDESQVDGEYDENEDDDETKQFGQIRVIKPGDEGYEPPTWENRDWDAQFARIDAILGNPELPFDEAQQVLLDHLRANLTMPCEVKGIEDFQWEEPYVIGGWSPAEYKRLRKTQPSYSDRFQLLSIDLKASSEWMMFDEDIAAHVRRVSDGKKFVLGLAELKVTDKNSPNYQLLDDYAVWFVNNR